MALLFFQVCKAQVPSWESEIQLTALPANQSVISAYSDGYGQHILTGTSGQVNYYLLGNDGQPVYSNPAPFPITVEAGFGAITGFQNIVYAAMEVSGQIKVFYSTNGGFSWFSSNSYTPPANPYHVDAFADGRGCHIVFSTETITVATKCTM